MYRHMLELVFAHCNEQAGFVTKKGLLRVSLSEKTKNNCIELILSLYSQRIFTMQCPICGFQRNVLVSGYYYIKDNNVMFFIG